MKNTTSTLISPGPLIQRNAENATRMKGILFMSGAVLCFTTGVLALRSSGILGSAWIATCVRYIVGLTIVSSLFLPSGHFKPINLIRNPDLIMRGILGSMGVYLFYETVPHLGAGISTFISTSYVVLAPLMAWIILKENLSIRQGILIGVAMIGMFIMSGVAGASPPPMLYLCLGLAGAVTSSLVVVYIRKLTQTEHSSTIFASQCFFGLMIGAGPAMVQCNADAGGHINWIGLLISGIATTIGQLLLTYGFKFISVTEGSLINLCTPVFIMTGGVLLFNEPCSVTQIIGSGLILGSCILMSARPKIR